MESELYVGIKLVKAKPMTLGEFKEHTSLTVNSNLPDEAEGFLVEYSRSEPNSPLYTNYVSWSPKGVFDEAYSKTKGMTSATIFFLLSKGFKLTRATWTDKLWIMAAAHVVKDGVDKTESFYIALLNDGVTHTGWQPDLQDLRAEDWMIVS